MNTKMYSGQHSLLDAYFERIGYGGETTPKLDTLRALQERHPRAIAFENLDVLLGRPPRLDLVSIERKLLHAGRGGYCYEHNILFADVLRAIGFHVTGLKARVLWNVAHGVIPPRSHMTLKVECEGGAWLADTGFGGQVLTGPIKFGTDAPQETPHENFRLAAAGGDDFLLQTHIADDWKDIYLFDLQAQNPADYEVANHYVATHPNSRFTDSLIVARTEDGKRITLLNADLKVRHLDGELEQHRITTVAQMHETLCTLFMIRLPDDRGLNGVLERALAAPDARSRRPAAAPESSV